MVVPVDRDSQNLKHLPKPSSQVALDGDKEGEESDDDEEIIFPHKSRTEQDDPNNPLEITPLKAASENTRAKRGRPTTPSSQTSTRKSARTG